MKLNKKGISLIELLVSIILISIVLVFLFQILGDLRDETANNDYAYNNQVNRMEIIKTIEDDLIKYDLIGVKDETDELGYIKITFDYHPEESNLQSSLIIKKDNDKDTVTYTNVLGEKNSWTMQSAEIDKCYEFTYYKENENSNSHYFKINIPIYNKPYHEDNNAEKNNPVDDIEITYLNDNKFLVNNDKYLTIDNNISQTIKKCAK